MTHAHIALIRPLLLDDNTGELPAAAVAALREQLRDPLLEVGLATSAGDKTALDRWTHLAFDVVQRFSSRPFTTQAEVAAELDLDRQSLVGLNLAIRRSPLAQRLIVDEGQASKYWKNTIVPLLQSGAIAAARQGRPRHPFRVGVYPGVSCMFFCSFCGRVHDAKYKPAAVAPGNGMFERIFRSAPTDDPYTFYVSGGLEPLTNPGIGALVSAGAARGFKLSIYTNGFMLTPQLLERQSGLWQLDTLRISLYGTNQESTARVTRHIKAFDQVRRNAAEFLRLRNERRSPINFGFNYVMLPGEAYRVLDLVELIAEVNRTAGGDRQVDFLTLREDYSVPPEQGLADTERAALIDVFERLSDRVAEDDLAGLEVDFGYGLHPMSRGYAGRALEMVEHTDMRRRGYPQVSVVVDLLGDVYLYREAGFLDRPGADRYIIGRVTPERSLAQVVEEHVLSRREIEPFDDDTRFFDIFDHVVTHLMNQADADQDFGIPFEQGPIEGRIAGAGRETLTVAHPTLTHAHGHS